MNDRDDQLDRIEHELRASSFWRAFAWVWVIIVLAAVALVVIAVTMTDL